MRTLVVVTHPNPDSLTRAAFARVLAGLERAGDEVRVIDLDAEEFDPRLTAAEKRAHIEAVGPTSPATDARDQEIPLGHHSSDLRWAERLVLVYPTWFGGFPARLKGWFDRSWVQGVAFHFPEGGNRVRAGLRNIRRLEIVTTHGNTRWINLVQGNPGRLTVFRTLRLLCHPLCRRRWTAIYRLDRAAPDEIERWLDLVEARYAG